MVIDCARPTTSGQPQAYTPGPDDPAVGTSAPSDFIVPLVTSTPDENGMVYHEVQYGQTLWAIAIEYGVKIDQIRVLNSLGTETDIYQGDRLLVRKDAPPVSTSVTVVNTAVPTIPVQIVSGTTFPTSTQLPAESPTMIPENAENDSVAGIAVGIVLAALLFAGLLTWMSSRKPVEDD